MLLLFLFFVFTWPTEPNRKRTEPQAADSANWTDIICVLCFLSVPRKTCCTGDLKSGLTFCAAISFCTNDTKILTDTLTALQSCQTSKETLPHQKSKGSQMTTKKDKTVEGT